MSGNPATRLAPTTDRVFAKRAIDGLTLQDSTAVGDALYVALSAIQMAPRGDDGSTAPGAIVMLSDGMNTAGRSPLQGAAEAREAEVPVYTIAYGTENGSVDLDGKRERVPPDRDLMRTIAEISGGSYAAAESAGDLSRVYENDPLRGRLRGGQEGDHRDVGRLRSGVRGGRRPGGGVAGERGGHDGSADLVLPPRAAVAAGPGAGVAAAVRRAAAAQRDAIASASASTTSAR